MSLLRNDPSIQGASGAKHNFSDVEYGTRPDDVLGAVSQVVVKVVDEFERRVTEIDVLATYAKAMDVRARKVRIVCPSCTDGAMKLAEVYGIQLRLK